MAAIGESKKIEINGGYVVLYPENPIFQEENDPDNDTKALYINLSMNAYKLLTIYSLTLEFSSLISTIHPSLMQQPLKRLLHLR